MKTAKALGIKIPNSIMLRADKVFEWNRRRKSPLALGSVAFASPLVLHAQVKNRTHRLPFAVPIRQGSAV